MKGHFGKEYFCAREVKESSKHIHAFGQNWKEIKIIAI